MTNKKKLKIISKQRRKKLNVKTELYINNNYYGKLKIKKQLKNISPELKK